MHEAVTAPGILDNDVVIRIGAIHAEYIFVRKHVENENYV